jgi:hypothetical protein
MPDKRLLALSSECRERAEEILVKAETFKDADSREGMRRSLDLRRTGTTARTGRQRLDEAQARRRTGVGTKQLCRHRPSSLDMKMRMLRTANMGQRLRLILTLERSSPD